ncbi:hypothetical protein E4S40_11440 [Algoriphagus kandeliae]|uniref:Uncharacterized protein n=1 Tax=Algoriphagus kandeliae TaxID=2562278 RepID=A0A4Y9QPT5_9BACT|nr:hypothetical protein [Algoriphagus kandeliae]TFV94619.1 hypothetical protein E4S40_11440 [Algoriphagus kandeliae]
MDQRAIVGALQRQGQVQIKEGNGKVLRLLKLNSWTPEMGNDWIFLLFDLFQIRSISGQFSEVSLDIVEFASKPTIYHTSPGVTIPVALANDGKIRFSLIRDKEWNKLLFQASDLMLCKIVEKAPSEFETNLFFPLLSPNLKEMYLSPEGDVKIIKG